jgi:Mn-dependent DtxR family transcriptional regulator
MARKPNDDRLQTIAQTIRDNPNRKPGWIARVLGLDNKSMMRALAQLEDQGVLLAEDDRGRVSVIDQRR